MKDDADDFVQCEQTYKKALGFYLEQQFQLILLGDVDELWETPLHKFKNNYLEIHQLEHAFHLRNNLFRIWGNHDDFWREKAIFRRFHGLNYQGLSVDECLAIDVYEGEKNVGEIVLLHGHQGNLASDRFATISRFIVRWLWRPWQKISGSKLSTPSHNLERRSKTDELLYAWIKKRNRSILIAGHTHQAVFSSSSHIDFLEDQLQNTTDRAEIERIHSEINRVKENQTRVRFHGSRHNCYFNSGCCSYDDGDITGIEIYNGTIRLIKWNQEGERIELRSDQLVNVIK